MKCPVCGAAELIRDTRDMPYAYKGASTTIEGVTGDFCPACDEAVLEAAESTRTNKLMMQFNKEITAAYEADEGALTIAQLTQIKKSAPKAMNAIAADSTAQNQVLPIPAVEQVDDIHLSHADQEAFAKALLSPEPPNAALKNATAKANEFFG